ncbi:putative S-adenosylmethionine-dependent methyltransferase of the seven beta-strand family [Xylariaceae sp. FL0016]|nr:putative S-adenosylmethionine-dependent methyltransferase of the seven beta-strand family [Xylariaceae sp. FL0016]
MSKPMHLEPSKLGTKEYWDDLYTRELANHAHDASDTGTVWFDDSDAEAKVLAFLSDEAASLGLRTPSTSFLDLGTGNGALLFALRGEGWEGPMLGVDYSQQSVEFARRLERARRARVEEEEEEGEEGKKEEKEEETAEPDQEQKATTGYRPISFAQHDILRDPPATLLAGDRARGWDVVLDKGTFDAVSLSAEPLDPSTGRRAGEGYRDAVLALTREGGVFLVTSCNWTEDELRRWFAEDEGGGKGERADEDAFGFEIVGRVAYRSFSFGGIKGQTISSLCLQKVRRERGGTHW